MQSIDQLKLTIHSAKGDIESALANLDMANDNITQTENKIHYLKQAQFWLSKANNVINNLVVNSHASEE